MGAEQWTVNLQLTSAAYLAAGAVSAAFAIALLLPINAVNGVRPVPHMATVAAHCYSYTPTP